MYNDSKDFIEYIKRNEIPFLEPIHDHLPKDFDVLNENLDCNHISSDFKSNGYVIIDNFLKPEYALRLRNFVYNTNIRHDYYKDYASINFSVNHPNRTIWFPLLSSILNEMTRKIAIFSNMNYERGWAFIHENKQTQSVKPHRDLMPITLNLWVTPDDCIENNSDEYNGIVIHNTQDLTKFEMSESIKVQYKFNRATIFNGNNIHHSLLSRFKDGYENKKVNYTFLFNHI